MPLLSVTFTVLVPLKATVVMVFVVEPFSLKSWMFDLSETRIV